MSAVFVPPANLSHQLRLATAAMHRRVERAPLMARLLRGELDRLHYADLLHNLRALYQALEEALAHHAGTPDVAPVVIPELFRGPAITSDLKVLAGAAICPDEPLADATRQYVGRVREISATHPGLLVAHAYVRYLGDLNGGQALRRVVAASLGLADGAGTCFYDFGDVATRQALEQRFRAGLEAVAVRMKDTQALIEEARSAFERHEQLFEELAAA